MTAVSASPSLAQQAETDKPADEEAVEEKVVPEDPPPPYEPQLERLSEVVGSLHFLRQICDGDDAEEWRERMTDLLEAENPSPLRKKKLISRFNRGYRSYSAVYTQCTSSAEEATARFVQEGKKLSEGIVNRYAN